MLGEVEAVASRLSEAGLFLQHPTTAECRAGISYHNPHLLLRPGAMMPRLEDLTIKDESGEENSDLSGSLSKSEKNKIMRVFDSANTAVASGIFDAASSLRLATALKEHQLVALSMMVERESGALDDLRFPSMWERSRGNQTGYRHIVTGMVEAQPVPLRGGLLADEMGLGKTLSLLALICPTLDELDKKQQPVHYPRGTLIVTPKSMNLSRHIRPGEIRCLVYHGSNRRAMQRGLSHDYDLVVTTYETLQRDMSVDGVLHGETWYRVVLDEAHRIRNRNSQNFKAVTAVQAHFRWCLTGTPIFNSLDDYCSLLSFLQVPVFGDKRSFDRWITAPLKRNKIEALQSLQDLVGATCFRRTKAMVKAAIELPKKNERVETVYLTGAEREVYEFFQAKASKAAGQLNGRHQSISAIRDDPKQNTMAIINILRRICNGGERLLPALAVEEWHDHQRNLRTEKYGAQLRLGPSTGWTRIIGGKNGDTKRHSELLVDVGTSQGVGAYQSAKVQALLRNLATEQRAEGESFSGRALNSVVFSQWTDMLDLVAESLQQRDYQYARIDGQSTLQSRGSEIHRFSKNAHCTIMLASIASAAEGIDLTAGRYIHLLEPHWNPMIEAQAVDRIHRIGQTRDVKVTRYLTENSIEDYVRWIQDDKKQVIAQSLNSVVTTQLELNHRRCENSRSCGGF
ncbi:SNF2 family N-terminal domain-containing protein [Aspergillus multicolor]|uniref:DEAD/DEAH box helicase n=1 Tax=Aspergillus multicolor TaxID=41759 RepID=UPI003CCE53F9